MRTSNGQIFMFCKPTASVASQSTPQRALRLRRAAHGVRATVQRALTGLLAVLPLVASAACWEEAGARYGIDPDLLRAIAWQESRGWTHAVGPRLPDGNRALGLMQINSIHLPNLRQYGVRREDLFDGCASARIGAWVLADCIETFGATWRAVGCYVAGPRSKNTAAQLEYVRSVKAHYDGYRRQSAARDAVARSESAEGG